MLTRTLRTVGRAFDHDIGGAVLIKLIAMPLSALLGLFALRALSQTYGADGIALYGLTIAIPILIPFADLGLGGAAVEIVANRANYPRVVVRRELLKILTILSCVGAVLAVASVLLWRSGVMGKLAGLESADAGSALALGVLIFAFTVPLALGYRILLGHAKNPQVIAAQTGSGLLGLSSVLVLSSMKFPITLVVIMPLVSSLCAAAVASCLAYKLMRVRSPNGEEVPLDVRIGRSVNLVRLAGANLVIGVSLPLAYQAGRLIIVHRAGTDELAMYTAAYALYGPFNSLLVTAGQSLWPRFTRIREQQPEVRVETVRLWSVRLILATLPVCVGLSFPGAWIASWTLDGVASPGDMMAVLISLALLLLVSGANAPFGMALMGERDVRFQAVCFVLMAGTSLGICFVLAPMFGAASAPLGSVWALMICLLIPSMYRISGGYNKIKK